MGGGPHRRPPDTGQAPAFRLSPTDRPGLDGSYLKPPTGPRWQRPRGQRVGSLPLRAVLVLAQRMARDVGCVGVVVDAKPEAVAFYEKLGFVPLEVTAGQLGDRPEPLPMFLEVGLVPAPTGSSEA